MRIVLIGAGNVATHLGRALQSGGVEILQVYSHTIESATKLARLLGLRDFTCDLKQLRDDADIYLMAIKDDAIAEVLSESYDNNALWLHTAGSVSLSVFEGKRKHYGVLYPMQSFTKDYNVVMKEVHFFIEGNDNTAENSAKRLASMISPFVHVIDSEQRKQVHLAAVFTSNFANFMYDKADEILQQCGLSFDAMMPLIKMQVEKLAHIHPYDAQTGPAVRGDSNVIKSHLNMLNGDAKNIYAVLSKAIYDAHHK